MSTVYVSKGHDITAPLAPDLASAPFLIEYRSLERSFVVRSSKDPEVSDHDVITTQDISRLLSWQTSPSLSSLQGDKKAPQEVNEQHLNLDEITVADAIDIITAREGCQTPTSRAKQGGLT